MEGGLNSQRRGLHLILQLSTIAAMAIGVETTAAGLWYLEQRPLSSVITTNDGVEVCRKKPPV